MKKDVLFCPKCKSTDLKRAQTYKGTSNTLRRSYKAPLEQFVCQDCGYEGSCPLIDKNELERLKRSEN